MQDDQTLSTITQATVQSKHIIIKDRLQSQPTVVPAGIGKKNYRRFWGRSAAFRIVRSIAMWNTRTRDDKHGSTQRRCLSRQLVPGISSRKHCAQTSKKKCISPLRVKNLQRADNQLRPITDATSATSQLNQKTKPHIWTRSGQHHISAQPCLAVHRHT